MNFQDILKKSFLEQFNSDMSTTTILSVLFVAALLGVYIFIVYRITCRKAFYSKGFAISLVVIGMVTASIIMAVQSSIVISLGMVGALSIVRFRTAIKDPMDLAFLFWAISVGIMCGATLFEVAIEASILITIVMLVLHFVPNARPTLLLMVNTADPAAEARLLEVVKANTKIFKVKSRNVNTTGMDMLIEVKTRREGQLIQQVSALEHIQNVTLMTHDGEITY